MPYSVGAKGTYGCSGYPVIKTKTGEVMGCHPSVENANKQLAALHINEPEASKVDQTMTPTKTHSSTDALYPSIGIKNPTQGRAGTTTGSKIKSKYAKKPKINNGRSGDAQNSDGAIASGGSGGSMGTKSLDCCPDESVAKAEPCWDGYVQRGMKPGSGGRMVPNCVPIKKSDDRIVEGDFVMAMTTEGSIVGQVEHVMLEGGTYGQPGNPYAVESTPENPAVAIRMLEEEDGVYFYTPYSIGTLMSNIKRIDMPNISLEDYEDEEKVSKAEGYSPPSGARSAARRAIKFKQDGKATGAGTMVGWTRAGQLARGETLSLSTVKRMYSYFSRHEVDKKGKDWGNQANPSNGYIMWLAWGGDAGYSWSRGVVQREKNKMDNSIWAGSAFEKRK
jgi:hypothetical protein